jgi:hypothetical protein
MKGIKLKKKGIIDDEMEEIITSSISTDFRTVY